MTMMVRPASEVKEFSVMSHTMVSKAEASEQSAEPAQIPRSLGRPPPLMLHSAEVEVGGPARFEREEQARRCARS